MKKFFVVILAMALIAVSLFAFVACDSGDPDVVEGWEPSNDKILRGVLSGTLSFVSSEHYMLRIEGFGSLNKNTNWARGEYWFEGEVGKSPLHMKQWGPDKWVYEEFGEDEMNNANDPEYDPSSCRLLGNDNKPVEEYEQEVVFEPDENGVYTVRFCLYGYFDDLAEAGGGEEDSWFVFKFLPPQDGTLGTNGELSPVQPGSGPDMFAVIIAVPIAAVVLIAGIIVTVVLVKKNKKKKAAAAKAGEGDLPYDDPEA